jgi:exodeoxyribonuclease-3
MISIYSWNVNGIRAVLKKDMFLPFLATENPDILCLQETKAKEEQVELSLPGYKQFWNSAAKLGYSGTAIFSKTAPLQVVNGLPEDIIETFKVSGDIYGDPNLEGRVVAAEYDAFWVVTVYTPNAKDDLSRIPLRHEHWDPAFLAYCKQLEKSKPVVFCGDLNVAHTEDDLANPKPNRGKKGFTTEERQGFSNFVEAGFVESLRRVTATIVGGATLLNPANGTLAGVLTMYSSLQALQIRSKQPKFIPKYLDQITVQSALPSTYNQYWKSTGKTSGITSPTVLTACFSS